MSVEAAMSSNPIHPFDEAIALERLDEGRYLGRTSRAYANLAGPFGGVTAAALLNAVMLDPRRLADPVALTVNFCAAIADGDYEIATRLVRGGRTTQHWLMELTQNGAVAATATAVCGARRSSWSHYPKAAPPAPPRESLSEMRTALRSNWVQRYAFRFALGGLEDFPRDDGLIESAHSLAYIGDREPRALDFLSLAAMTDAFFLRIMHARGTMQPMATVSMTSFFHVGAAELAALGEAAVLGEADAAIFHDNFADQTCALWSEAGRLLANGAQITWYKE